MQRHTYSKEDTIGREGVDRRVGGRWPLQHTRWKSLLVVHDSTDDSAGSDEQHDFRHDHWIAWSP